MTYKKGTVEEARRKAEHTQRQSRAAAYAKKAVKRIVIVKAIEISLSIAILILLLVSMFGCSRPIEATWLPKPWKLDTPAQVAFLKYEIKGRHRSALHHAMDAFPCSLFRPWDGVSPVGVIVRAEHGYGRPCGGRGDLGRYHTAGASTYLCRAGHAEIWVSERTLNRANITASYLVFYHELGHALGLDDDPPVRVPSQGGYLSSFVSVMAKNAPDHSDRLELGALLPVLSDADEDAIEGKYCGR